MGGMLQMKVNQNAVGRDCILQGGLGLRKQLNRSRSVKLRRKVTPGKMLHVGLFACGICHLVSPWLFPLAAPS